MRTSSVVVVVALLAAAACCFATASLSPEGDAAARAAASKYKPGDRPLSKDLTDEELGKVDSQIKELEDFFSAGNNKDLKPGEKRQFRRAFHAKGFCLRATVKVEGSGGDAFKQGIYAKQGAEFPAWVRWSNGLGSVNADAQPDVRGMAVKIFVEGEGNKDKTLDLLSTNGPVPTNNSPQTLAEFQLTMANSGIFALASQAAKSVSYFWKHPMTLKLLLRSVLNPPRSFAREQFWSGSPYKVGGSVVKFNFFPDHKNNAVASDPANGKNRLLDLGEDNAEVADDKEGVLAALTRWRDALKRLKGLALDKDYLKNDMRDRAKSKSLSYKIQLQLFKDEKTTPTEDLFTEWRESDAPSTPVATLTIPQQQWDEKLQEECENASFNPMHAALDHSPYGHVNTARKHIYATSHTYRHQKNEL